MYNIFTWLPTLPACSIKMYAMLHKHGVAQRRHTDTECTLVVRIAPMHTIACCIRAPLACMQPCMRACK